MLPTQKKLLSPELSIAQMPVSSEALIAKVPVSSKQPIAQMPVGSGLLIAQMPVGYEPPVNTPHDLRYFLTACIGTL